MAVPKKRKSKQKSRQGKAGRPALIVVKATACPNCGSPRLPHRVCGNCGYYNGRVHNIPSINGSSEETAA
jgi:large subunit ribosomal protein L32